MPCTERLSVSVSQAAQMIGIRRDLMYRLIMAGAVPSFKIGARRLIPTAALRDYVERQVSEAEE